MWFCALTAAICVLIPDILKASIHCENGLSSSDGLKCLCFAGWQGDKCHRSKCVHGLVKIDSRLCLSGSCYYEVKGRNNGRDAQAFRCQCDHLWEGKLCDLPQCLYGNRLPNGTCACVGNYEPPHCQTCLPGFWGMNCLFNTSNLRSLNDTETVLPHLRYTDRGNAAIALGLATGFCAMLCLALVFLYRCVALIVNYVCNTCPLLYRASGNSSNTRLRPSARPMEYDAESATPFLMHTEQALNRSSAVLPPSYEDVLNSPPPSYSEIAKQ